MASLSQGKQKEELKQQGAIEAARDPNSKITPEDAERRLVEGSRAAGAAAFQFDPNASPEEKAAQARANVPKDFHHEHKSNATGVVSDADLSGKPTYDLTTASKASALPPPTGDPSKDATAVAAPEEDARWARDRTGWGPRFGYGNPEDDEGPNLADHQTWLETRLADTFYGDWYYNAGIIIFACLATYVSTMIGGGLPGMFIVLAICSTYYRTSIRRVRRNYRDDIHRELAKTRIETETESLEWINSFLVKFWPIFQPVLAESIIASVDQVLSTSTPAFLDSLRLKTFTLGSKPPRMEHVKTYPKTEEDIVMMDWKFSFNPNDTSDLTFRQLKNKINPKVVLEIRLGKGIVSKGLDVIVEDMAFSGLMRVKLKLQIPFPHVERAEICFLERPHIDYVCKPLGGDTFGFDINFIPGLETFIQEQIHANLAPMMYDPNVFPIEIAKMLSGNAVDQAVGVVQVTLHNGQGLKNPDKFPGIPDPYVAFSINGRETVGKSKTIKQNSNPRWDQTFNIIVTSLTDTLMLDVYDWNEYRKDKDLGSASFPLDRLQNEEVHENLSLEVLRGGRPGGILSADIRFFPVLEGVKGADGTVGEVPESNTGIARFTIEQAKDLDGSKSFVGQLNPYAVLLLNGKEVHVAQKLKRTNNPIWPNGSKEMLITDRKNAKLGLVIKDDRDISVDPIIGTYQIRLNDMLELMARGQEWYNLAGVKSGRAKMMVQWKPVALTGALGGSGGYVTPIGVMRFHFQNARDVLNLEGLGKSDPYGRVLLSGVEKGRTVTFQNNLNPDWDEVIYVPVHSARERLTVEVMDQENFGSDRSLGSVDLMASEFIHQNENGEYIAHDEKRQRSDALKVTGSKRAPKGTLNYTVAFYPTVNVWDPEEEAQKEAKQSLDSPRPNGTLSARPSIEGPETPKAASNRDSRSGTISSLRPSLDQSLAKKLSEGEKEQSEADEVKTKKPPKVKISAEDLPNYESGLLVFKILEADLAQSNCHLEIVMDDYLYPSFTSSRATSKRMAWNETGDAMVRELDMSKITLRLRQKIEKKGDSASEDHTLAKLTGNTLEVLQRNLYQSLPLQLKDDAGRTSTITVQLKFLPVKMQLDPSESISNMGTLRVEIHDAADLPAADRNGFSDPYCKFILNGKQIYKTETQKKTLHPSWNESFETKIVSRTAACFKLECYDWDRGDSDDLLGTADINLNVLEPLQKQEVVLNLDGKSGAVRLNMLFKPDYVTRARQGTTTFQGTFAVPGKVIGAPVKGVGKAGMFVGGNVVKGASFVGRGFRRRKTDGTEEVVESIEEPDANGRQSFPPTASARAVESNGVAAGAIPTISAPSVGRDSISSAMAPSTFGDAGVQMGSAHFTVVSASGYEGNNIRVTIKLSTPKGLKEVHKTREVKAVDKEVQFDEHHESFRVECPADSQFTVSIKDNKTFGTDKELGEGMLVIVDSLAGGAKTVRAGAGTILFRSSFRPAEIGSTATPEKRNKFFGSMRRQRSATPGGESHHD